MALSADPSKPDHVRVLGNLHSNNPRKIHIVGRPGRGNSSLLEHMVLEDLRLGRVPVLLDPHGHINDEIDPEPATALQRMIAFIRRVL